MNTKVKNMLYCALFACLIAILAQIQIALPTLVPITLQTLGVYLVSLLLKPKLAFISTLVYVFMGTIGLPVFGGFSGGLASLLGPSGGYIFSFPIMALVIALIVKRNEKLSFSDQTGTNFVLKNAQPYTFIKEKIYGNEFEYTTSYEYGLINYTIIHNLKFSQDGLTAEWNVKKLNTAAGKVLESYSGTGYVYTNIAQDEIYFYTWFFDDGIYSNEDMLLPPRYLVDIDLKETSSGKTTISANSGHYSWDKISLIQK